MSKLSTEQTFGGRRAVVGDSVVIAVPRHDGEEGVCLCAGVVHAVSASDDVPWIARTARLNGSAHSLRDRGGASLVEPTKGLTFFFAPSESTASVMPIGYWTWQSFLLGA